MSEEERDFFFKVMWSRELWEISSELADTARVFFDAVLDYCKEKDIPIDRKEPFMSLMRRMRHLFKLVETLRIDLKSLKLPPFKFDDRDPEELPEPVTDKFKDVRLTLDVGEHATNTLVFA